MSSSVDGARKAAVAPTDFINATAASAFKGGLGGKQSDLLPAEYSTRKIVNYARSLIQHSQSNLLLQRPPLIKDQIQAPALSDLISIHGRLGSNIDSLDHQGSVK